jgi:hypothetical protein
MPVDVVVTDLHRPAAICQQRLTAERPILMPVPIQWSATGWIF